MNTDPIIEELHQVREQFAARFNYDVAAMVAYLKTLEPWNHQLPERRIGPVARLLIAVATSAALPAAGIDHAAQRAAAPPPGVTAEYGAYLAITCVECHGEDFSGGFDPGEGMNITPGGNLGTWTEGDFLLTIRLGRTPDGRWLDTDWMPLRRIRNFTDDELRAIYLYLRSLPPVERAIDQ